MSCVSQLTGLSHPVVRKHGAVRSSSTEVIAGQGVSGYLGEKIKTETRSKYFWTTFFFDKEMDLCTQRVYWGSDITYHTRANQESEVKYKGVFFSLNQYKNPKAKYRT